MPNWNEILDELKSAGSTYDIIRRKYLQELHKVTRRNTIIYYSGWLQKPNTLGIGINDQDKVGFMTTVNQLDPSKGLDLILHTPGGETAATESIVDYLHKIYTEKGDLFWEQGGRKILNHIFEKLAYEIKPAKYVQPVVYYR